MPLLALLGAGLLAGLVVLTVVGEAAAFDPTRYPPGRLQEIVEGEPRTERRVVLKAIPLRAHVQYTGEFRMLSDEARRHIAAWAAAFQVPQVPPLFREEVKALENGTAYWMPVQESMAHAMAEELHPGDEIEMFVLYIGQRSGRHLFLVNVYGHEGDDAPALVPVHLQRLP